MKALSTLSPLEAYSVRGALEVEGLSTVTIDDSLKKVKAPTTSNTTVVSSGRVGDSVQNRQSHHLTHKTIISEKLISRTLI